MDADMPLNPHTNTDWRTSLNNTVLNKNISPNKITIYPQTFLKLLSAIK